MEMHFYRCEICGKIIALLDDPGTPTICCGQEMKELIVVNDCDMAVFDNELSPSQMRVLQEELGVKVLASQIEARGQ